MNWYKLNGKEILAVKVPKSKIPIHEFVLQQLTDVNLAWLHFVDKVGIEVATGVQLPPGSYSILGRGRDLTEEQWRGLVENLFGKHYKDYTLPDDHKGYGGPFVCHTATASGLSWFKANGIDENYLLIIKM